MFVPAGLSPIATVSSGQYQNAASYIDRLLRGTKLSELPIQATDRFETVINHEDGCQTGHHDSSRRCSVHGRRGYRVTVTERVLIAGAGPVGLVAASHLARAGVPVTVFEQGATLSEESRASTFHPPTLDMLHALGAAEPLMAQGLKAPTFQYRTKKQGLLAEFDFAAIADATQHPYRVQCEQSKLTRILYEQMRGHPNFEMVFGAAVKAVSQDGAGVRSPSSATARPSSAPAAI